MASDEARWSDAVSPAWERYHERLFESQRRVRVAHRPGGPAARADLALKGVRRVLRDGGRVAYAVWGPLDRNPWITMMAMAVVQNGHEPPGDPFAPGGVFSLAVPESNMALLKEAGFTDVVLTRTTHRVGDGCACLGRRLRV